MVQVKLVDPRGALLLLVNKLTYCTYCTFNEQLTYVTFSMRFCDGWLLKLKDKVSQYPGALVPIVDISPAHVDVMMKSRKKAAVFIPLCHRHGIASILFTVRSNTVGSHKGQVSFPGGHIDGDEGSTQAACRETYEELGSNVGNLSVLGVCQTIPSVTGMPVTPILGFIEVDVFDFEAFTPSTQEVDRVFTRSVEQLLDPHYKSYEMLTRSNGAKVRMPVFGGSVHDGCENNTSEPSYCSDERIWGLTALILDAVLQNIILPTK